jgi:hypothetical protein
MILYFANILFFFLSPSCSAQTVDTLAAVKIIHIGEFTGDDHAERFRSLVSKELSDRGFIVTENANTDVTLSGSLQTMDQEDTPAVSTGGMVTVTSPKPRLYCECKTVLISRNGVVLWKWEGSTGSKRPWDTVELEPIANLALKLARALEKDYRKAIKQKK